MDKAIHLILCHKIRRKSMNKIRMRYNGKYKGQNSLLQVAI